MSGKTIILILLALGIGFALIEYRRYHLRFKPRAPLRAVSPYGSDVRPDFDIVGKADYDLVTALGLNRTAA